MESNHESTHYSILLIDDNPVTNFLNEQILKKIDNNLTIWKTESTLEALDIIDQLDGRQERMVIILDINMPGLNGLDFLERLNTMNINSLTLSVVVLSSGVSPQEIEKLRGMGVSKIILKPLSIDKIKFLCAEYK